MMDAIRALLGDLEQRHNVRVLFAVEAGSRAWGTASQASDYDVRFVFCRALPLYASLDAAATTIEHKDGRLDVHGWDARKALALQGNGALLEWLRSPIVYADRFGLLCSWRAHIVARAVLPQLAKYYGGLLQRERKLCVGGRREIEDLKVATFVAWRRARFSKVPFPGLLALRATGAVCAVDPEAGIAAAAGHCRAA